MDTHQSDKACFFVLYMYSRHPNIFQAYMGASKDMAVSTHIQGASKHRDAQTYRGVSTQLGAYKHTGGVQAWGIQTYRGLSKHMGHPNIQGVIQTYGASKHTGGTSKYMEASKHWGCPNIWGHPNICGHPNIQEGVQT